MNAAGLLVIDAPISHRPPIVKRPPLGPFPKPVDYDHVLKFTPPAGPDTYFYRGNFCGIRLVGAPVVPGGNAANPDLVMACLLDNYPREWQEKYLFTYASYGYTHLQRSIGHSMFYGGTVQTHIDLSKRAQSYGLFCDEWFLGGGEGDGWMFKTRDQDAAYWDPFIGPIVAQMLAAGAVDTACVGWQLDQWNAPGNPLISIIAMFARLLPATVPLYTHWMNEAMAWWKTGGEVWIDPLHWPFGINVTDRFSWWLAMQPYLTGGYHQGSSEMAVNDPGLYQAKMRDTLNPFSDGRMGNSERNGPRNFAFIEMEPTAQFQFDNVIDENQGDLTGYLLTCTISDGSGGVMAGYGNGARMPDGSPL